MTRALLALCMTFTILLSGCGPRGVVTLLPGFLPRAVDASVQRVYIATDRRLDPGDPASAIHQTFGESRDAVMRYGHIDVSIPPVHQIGRIEWPRGETPDPARHFVAVDGVRYEDQSAFLQDLPKAGGDADVLLFVHGYNVNNAEAVYRMAQIAHDYDTDVPAISFSWPSAGDPRGYVYDRDSVIFARDDLEKLLLGLARDRRQVMIIAHSMGSQLVMETLRQMSISGKGHALNSLVGLALISPDIDEDVFLRQARRITPFPQPFMIMVSQRDKILNIAALLTGRPSRLGSIKNPKRLAELPIEIIDLSEIEGGDRAGHATAFTAPAAIRLLRDLATP